MKHYDEEGRLFPDPDTLGNRQIALVCYLIDVGPISYSLLRKKAAYYGRPDPYENVQALLGRGYLRYADPECTVLEATPLAKKLIDNLS